MTVIDQEVANIRRAQAIAALWRAGLSYDDIAREVHCCTGAIAKAIKTLCTPEEIAQRSRSRKRTFATHEGGMVRREPFCRRCGFPLAETHLSGITIPPPVGGVCGLCQEEAAGHGVCYTDTWRTGDAALYEPEMVQRGER